MTREEREQRADARAERRIYLQEMRLEETRKRTAIQEARFVLKVAPIVIVILGVLFMFLTK